MGSYKPIDPDGPQPALPDHIADRFESRRGAKPFRDQESLESAMNDLFWYRSELGLEVAIMASIAPTPDISTCSEETRSIGENLSNTYIDGILFGVDQSNYAPWVELTTAWVNANPLLPLPVDHEFKWNDDEFCRANFTELQTLYTESYDDFQEDVQNYNNMHREILRILEENNVTLVDNKEFIEWAMSHENSDIPREDWMGELPDVLDSWAQSHWYRDYGAAPLVTVKSVKEAMTAMFWFRVSVNLEFAALADIMPLPDIENCSESTKAIGYKIGSAWYEGSGAGLDLMNEEQFLERVIEWLEEKYDE